MEAASAAAKSIALRRGLIRRMVEVAAVATADDDGSAARADAGAGAAGVALMASAESLLRLIGQALTDPGGASTAPTVTDPAPDCAEGERGEPETDASDPVLEARLPPDTEAARQGSAWLEPAPAVPPSDDDLPSGEPAVPRSPPGLPSMPPRAVFGPSRSALPDGGLAGRRLLASGASGWRVAAALPAPRPADGRLACCSAGSPSSSPLAVCPARALSSGGESLCPASSSAGEATGEPARARDRLRFTSGEVRSGTMASSCPVGPAASPGEAAVACGDETSSPVRRAAAAPSAGATRTLPLGVDCSFSRLATRRSGPPAGAPWARCTSAAASSSSSSSASRASADSSKSSISCASCWSPRRPDSPCLRNIALKSPTTTLESSGATGATLARDRRCTSPSRRPASCVRWSTSSASALVCWLAEPPASNMASRASCREPAPAPATSWHSGSMALAIPGWDPDRTMRSKCAWNCGRAATACSTALAKQVFPSLRSPGTCWKGPSAPSRSA
mmetsp:Transcript_9148/g.35785  ORF Transcript_9148/g.35785 Transcript_9148/m.35785 type:complete len:508 (-) Transcript_9148:89-1612(-)